MRRRRKSGKITERRYIHGSFGKSANTTIFEDLPMNEAIVLLVLFFQVECMIAER